MPKLRSIVKRRSPVARRRVGGGSPPATPFPQAPLDINVAIYVDSSWIDITPSVYGGNRTDIQISRGRANEAGQVDPSRASFQLNNRDGQFSPRNPTSWLYGKIGRNTPVRIRIGADARFHGEISEWPQRWDTTGTDIWVPIEASGILRRLTQGATPLKSTMYRGLTSLTNPPKAYWPCEDGTDATQIASALGGPPMNVTGTPGFGQHSDFKCSAPLPLLGGSEWYGTVPAHTGTGNIQVWWLMHIPAGEATVDRRIITIYTTGTVAEWALEYAASDGDLRLKAYAAGVELSSSLLDFNVNDKLLRIGIQLEQNGSDIDWSIDTLEVGATFAGGGGGTLASHTISRCHAVRVNTSSSLGDNIAIGHIAVHDEILDLFDLEGELNAYVGETAGTRIRRLCTEEGISFRRVGINNTTAAMGAQLPAELVTLLRAAADADGGILYEPREEFGLAYRSRVSLYTQTARLALDYSAAHLSGIEPVDDDQQVRNDVTVSRAGGGSSARKIATSGPLSVEAPPDGIGRYDTSVELNLESDAQIPDAAGWLLHLGTVDEARYPVLDLDLARAVFAADAAGAALAETARGLDVGDRLTVDNPPAWLPPEAITQLAQGFTEVLGNFRHRIDVNCSPESPWSQVARYDDGVSRYTSDGSTLAASLTTSATSVSVATPSGPLWSHDDGDFDLRVGGEVMTVTAVAGGSSPQTFTVTRSVNGVVKTHPAGAEVELDQRRVYVR